MEMRSIKIQLCTASRIDRRETITDLALNCIYEHVSKGKKKRILERGTRKYPIRAAPVMPAPYAKKIDNKKKWRDRVLIRVRDYASWIGGGKTGAKSGKWQARK